MNQPHPKAGRELRDASSTPLPAMASSKPRMWASSRRCDAVRCAVAAGVREGVVQWTRSFHATEPSGEKGERMRMRYQIKHASSAEQVNNTEPAPTLQRDEEAQWRDRVETPSHVREARNRFTR